MALRSTLRGAAGRAARKGLVAYRKALARLSGSESFPASRVVWIFGSGRTGSTWLAGMIDDLEGQRVWHEPLVGALFGNFYEQFAEENARKSAHFIFGDSHKHLWLRSVREIVLDGAASRFPRLPASDHLFVKEPNGSVGAPVLMEALPESRMVLLVRDPRDVVASSLDAHQAGSWLYENRKGDSKKSQFSQAEQRPDAYVKGRANAYSRQVGNAKRAYEQHTGYKTLVRYEDLRRETLSTMQRMYRELGISVDERALGEAVEKHSWERIPQEKKGEGKFYRKGVAGGWREDLTQRQVEIVERITRPLIDEFYPD